MTRRELFRRWMALGSALLVPDLVWAGRVNSTGRSTAYPAVPIGYIHMGRIEGIPPLILYSVALQESAQLFGKHTLPYPWTLNVAGTPRRFQTYEAAVAGLRTNVAKGITSVDCGLMQVNWRYHYRKLGNFYQALDPYPNLRAGALILREEYARTGDWFKAVGRYHSPENMARAYDYANAVYRRMARVSHA